MRTFWLKTCRSFENRVYSAAFLPPYGRLQCGHPPIADFATPQELVAHLRSRLPLPKEKDPVFHSLLSAARETNGDRAAATSLLFLALAPGLSTVVHRTQRHFCCEEDCVGQVTLWFFSKVARWNLANQSGIAANLCLSTLHGVLDDLKKEWADQGRGVAALQCARALSDGNGEDDELIAGLWRSLGGGEQAYEPDDPEIAGIRLLLLDELHLSLLEADLLLLKGPCNYSWETIGKHLQMKPESARKRHQRLCERLKDHPLFHP